MHCIRSSYRGKIDGTVVLILMLVKQNLVVYMLAFFTSVCRAPFQVRM